MDENYLILSRKNLSTVSFAIGFPFGAAMEEINGATEVMTSHLFRNTAKMNEREFAIHLDKHGIVTFDSVTKTGMWLGMNTPPQNLDVALDAFNELLLENEFEADILSRIIQQQKGNLQQFDQIPQMRLFQRTRWEAAFGQSKVSRSSLGTLEGLDSLTVDGLEENYASVKQYQPQFVAVGIDIADNDFEAIEPTMHEFGTKSADVDLWDNSVEPLNVQVDKMANKTKNAYMGINLISHGHENEKNDDLVYKNVLAGGFSARFFTEIRDKRNLSYSTFVLNSKFPKFGLVTGGMDVRPDRAEEARDVALQIMKDVLNEDIREEEMNRALKAAQKTALFVSDSSQNYTGWLMQRRLTGQEWDLEKVRQNLIDAAEADWQENMLQYWKKENFSLAIAGEPGDAADTWKESVEKVL